MKLIRVLSGLLLLASPIMGWTCSDANWMSCYGDGWYLSQLTLPGTHDSGARQANGRYIPVRDWTIAQNLSIAQQLGIGVRFLDIRFGSPSWTDPAKKRLEIYHGPVPQGITGDQLLTDVFAFLDSHPRETIILSVKDEDSSHPYAFEQMMYDLIARWSRFGDYSYAKYDWWLNDYIPKLGQARGKIVLVRRFAHGGSSKVVGGMDATQWPNNKTGSFRNFSVEDRYTGIFFSPFDKEGVVADHLDYAHARTDKRMYLTFASANGLKDPGLWTIKDYSSRLNDYLKGFFASHTGFHGLVAVDYVDQKLAHAIWTSN